MEEYEILIHEVKKYLFTKHALVFDLQTLVDPSISSCALAIKEGWHGYLILFKEEPLNMEWVIHELAHIAAWAKYKRNNLGHGREFIELYEELEEAFL